MLYLPHNLAHTIRRSALPELSYLSPRVSNKSGTASATRLVQSNRRLEALGSSDVTLLNICVTLLLLVFLIVLVLKRCVLEEA